MDRINIGNKSVVGAGSVVLQDVQENVVVVGVPAKILRNNRKVHYFYYMLDNEKG